MVKITSKSVEFQSTDESEFIDLSAMTSKTMRINNPLLNNPSFENFVVGTVTSVSGTPDRIDVTGTAINPIVDIASTYVGQESITTLGNIETGTWNGDVIDPDKGGTGMSATNTSSVLLTDSIGDPLYSDSLTDGQLIIGSTGLTPSITTLTAGSGISIDNGAGSITVSADAVSGDLDIDKIYSTIFLVDLGLNELSNMQTLAQGTTGTFRKQGSSVSIADDASVDYIAAGAPFDIPVSTKGGILIYENSSDGLFTLEGEYSYSAFTPALSGTYSHINADGNLIAFGTGELDITSNIRFIRRTGSVWATVPSEDITAGLTVKLYGTDRCLVGNKNAQVSIYSLSAGTWSVVTTLETVYQPDYAHVISNMAYLTDKICYFYSPDDEIKIWTYSVGTWTESTPISAIGLVSFYAYSNYILYSDASNFYIYENEILIKTFATAGIVACSMVISTDNYIFFSTTTTIYIATIKTGVWTESYNATSHPSTITSMHCNGNRLVVACNLADTYGRVYVYDINPFSNDSEVENNSVFLKPITDNLDITSAYKDISITAANIAIRTNDTTRLSINDSLISSTIPISTPFGTAADPSYVFNGSLDTGIYSNSGANLCVSVEGSRKLEITEDFSVHSGGVISNNGYILLRGNGSQVISNSTVTKLTTSYFDETAYDYGDTVSTRPRTLEGDLFAYRDGTYAFSYTISWEDNGSGDMRTAWVETIGGIRYGGIRVRGSSTLKSYLTGSAIIPMVTGQQLRLYVYQDSGSNATVNGSLYPGQFSLTRLF